MKQRSVGAQGKHEQEPENKMPKEKTSKTKTIYAAFQRNNCAFDRRIVALVGVS